MKLFNSKEDSMYLTRKQWKKIFMLGTVMTLVLYTVALICSLNGINYFILNYQNDHMDRIEAFLRSYNIYPLAMYLFSALEFSLVLSFVLNRPTRFWYPLIFYGIRIGLAFAVKMPSFFNTVYPFIFYLTIPIIEQIIENKRNECKTKFSFKKYGFQMIRLLMATAVTLLLQAMILGIKAGYFDGVNHVMNLSATTIYAIEYDIALFVLLMTLALYINGEKGDNKSWTTYQAHGGSSQISKTKSAKSYPKKNLTKAQKSKLRRLYAFMYVTQLGAFLLVMVLPFLLGKVFEFMVMYMAFAIARYLLGFKYSLHYKKETTCITVGVLVFGILSLVVPFFYVTLILAISMGIGLAILLHLSYKYKGMFLFAQISKPDKFAQLYVFFEGNLEHYRVQRICKAKGLDELHTSVVCDFVAGDKLTYIAFRHNYSLRMINYILKEGIAQLTA